MIECQIVVRSAILAREAVPQKHVEPGEGRIGCWLYKRLERNDAGQQHLETRTAHCLLVVGYDVHAVQKHGLDRILPAPQRQGIVAQRTKIRVEYQGWPPVMRHMSVHADAPPPRPKRKGA